jgi:hypothetical protein
MLLCKFCNKEGKNKNSLSNHERLCKLNPDRQETALMKAARLGTGKKVCVHCGIIRDIANIGKHEKTCKENPASQKPCPVCHKPFKGSSTTCSHACANTHFRSGRDSPRWKDSVYRSTCFEVHEKKCIICGETKIVAVHHMDENKKNNNPENLVPLCPTHHQYVHSKFKNEVLPQIEKYISNKFSV